MPKPKSAKTISANSNKASVVAAAMPAFNPFTAGMGFMQQFSEAMSKNIPNMGAAIGLGAMPKTPGMPDWAMPTMDAAEVDKRINELKTVKFWLEQNTTALQATIQALEVQKMTLQTLQAMSAKTTVNA